MALLYRAVPGSSPVAGLLAGLLFAVEDAHAYPGGWLANRNALLCLVLGVLTVLFHLRWRRTGRFSWLVTALLLFAAGLACGEATLGALAYLAAWHLTMEKGRPKARALAAVLPCAGLVLLWRLLYDALGYGTTGSSLYVDPPQHPLRFVGAVIERWPVLAAGQWFQLPIDLWLLLSRTQRVVLALAGVLLTAGLVVLLRPLLRQPAARFWFLGMTLSLVPVCAAFPMDRLLVFAGIGSFALLALLVDSYVLSRSGPPGCRWRRGVAILLLVLHGPLAAVLLTVRTAGLPAFGRFFTAAARHNPTGPEILGQTFVYVNGNDFPVFYGRVVPIANDAPAPRRVVQLAAMTTDNRIHRPDASTLVITPRGGFLARSIDSLLASDDYRFRPGDRVQRPDFEAEVISLTEDGRPASVSFRFRSPLEDPSIRWLCWEAGRLVEFQLPQVGATVELARIRLFP